MNNQTTKGTRTARITMLLVANCAFSLSASAAEPSPQNDTPAMPAFEESSRNDKEVFTGSRAESKFAPEKGFYIAVQGLYNVMAGDFDDTILLSNSEGDIVDVPDVDNGFGFGIALGARLDGGVIEVCYQRTLHDTRSVLFGSSEAAYNVVDFNLKLDLLKRRVRPYAQLGFGFPWLTIDGASFTDFRFEDATFFGLGVNVGGGLSYFINEHLAATGGVVYRYNWFVSAEGTSLEDNLSEHTVSCSIGLAYTF